MIFFSAFKHHSDYRRVIALLFTLCCAFTVSNVKAHPLGNFSVNQYSRLEIGAQRIVIRYIVDMAEIAAFQELTAITSAPDRKPTRDELRSYLDRVTNDYLNGLSLIVDEEKIPLKVLEKTISQPLGSGGMMTLRLEFDFAGSLSKRRTESVRHLRFENRNHHDRTGWHEIVISPFAGISVFNTSSFGSGVTEELKAYPENMLMAPLDERTTELSFTSGQIPSNARMLLTRDGQSANTARDRFPEADVFPALIISGTLVLFGISGALFYRLRKTRPKEARAATSFN